jgi:hypothetical protein
MVAQVKVVSVRVFEVFSSEGSSLGLFRVDAEWQGMQKLVQIDNPSLCLIVDVDGAGIGGIFNAMFGEHRAEVGLVKASPDLLLKLAKSEDSL